MKNANISNAQQQIQVLNPIQPDALFNPRSLGFSHAVEVRHFLRVLHISAQGGHNAQGQLSRDFVKQAEQAFKNIRCILDEADATLRDIAMLRIYLLDHSAKKHQQFIQVMQHVWKDQAFPACSWVPVTCLSLPNMLIAIEATAYCF